MTSQPPTPQYRNLKFYYAPGACSLAPHVLLHELNITHTLVRFNVDDNGNDYPPSFMALNPKLRVPTLTFTLVEGERKEEHVLTEAPAICLLISLLSPTSTLMGTTSLQRVRVAEWMNYLSGTLHTHFTHLIRVDRFTNCRTEEARNGLMSKSRENVLEGLRFVEASLKVRLECNLGKGGEGGREEEKENWAVGNEFTAVDVYMFVFWRWGVHLGFQMEEFGWYRALMERVAERESVRKILGIEGVKSFL